MFEGDSGDLHDVEEAWNKAVLERFPILESKGYLNVVHTTSLPEAIPA
jgi:hypothetical protein